MLGLSPLPRTLAAALRDAAHDRLPVRLSALRDLARHAADGSDAARERLCAALRGDAAVEARAEAAVALADARVTSAVDDLVASAGEDEAPRVRQMALVALGELAGPEHAAARAVVARALRDAQPEIRFQALIAHARLAGEAALDALERATRDEDAQVRYVAFRLGEERWLAARGAELPARWVAAARRALGDDDARVRLVAALLLARTGDASGAEVIVEAVRSGRGADEPEDLQAAIELAAELRLGAARDGLERRAFGVLGVSRDAFAWHARVALARLGDARARRAILRGLQAWSRDARTLAVAAAGRARLAEARARLLELRGQPDRAEPSAVEEALALLSGEGDVDAGSGRGQDPGHDPAP